MRTIRHHCLCLACLWLALLSGSAGFAASTDTLVWNKDKDRVDADVRGVELWPLLERIATATGWQILVEPGTAHTASTKFKDLPSGEALRLLLGDLNFAFVPQTNASPHLYVFRTGMQNATRLVQAVKETAGARRVPNELIVKLKPGANIDELARKLGAKVVACIEALNICRLRFENAATADAAFSQLILNNDVDGVDYNYVIDNPVPAREGAAASALPPQLQLDPPSGSGRVIVGLIDTAYQPSQLCGDLNKFMLNPISAAGETSLANDFPTHGTAMAIAILQGLAAGGKGHTPVQILPVDVYGPNRTTSTFDVAAGIVAAVNHGANVINLSLGGTGDSALLRSLVQSVRDRGIPILAAAGNEPVTTPFYPAAYPGVIAVTAVDQGRIAAYANRGSFVSVGAPGSEVFCFNGQSYTAQGTSSATAYTTGLMAGSAGGNPANLPGAQRQILDTMRLPNGSGP